MNKNYQRDVSDLYDVYQQDDKSLTYVFILPGFNGDNTSVDWNDDKLHIKGKRIDIMNKTINIDYSVDIAKGEMLRGSWYDGLFELTVIY